MCEENEEIILPILYKNKRRCYRRSQTERIINNRLKFLKTFDPKYYSTFTERKNKFSKRHPFDCGKSKCLVCHSEKLLYSKQRRRRFRNENIQRFDI
jgi:hypothetical protein